jgi:hypothetical protein
VLNDNSAFELSFGEFPFDLFENLGNAEFSFLGWEGFFK